MNETIELEEKWAVISIPKDTVEIELNIKVFYNGELVKVGTVMGLDDVRTALRKAEEGYIDEDDRFVSTDNGKAYLDSLRASMTKL